MIRAVFLAALLAPLPPAAAPAAAQSVAAQAGAEALARRCRASGGTPRATPGLVRAIDLGGRGAAALDARRLTCAGAPPVDCGPFGCKLSIYFGGPVAVFETHVKAWRARAGRLDVMRVGAYCAGSRESCSETYRVEGEGLALAGKGEATFAADPAPKPSRRVAATRAAPTPSASARRTDARGAGSQATDRRAAARPARAPTRGTFDGAGDPPAAAPRPAPVPVAPAAAAERRRRLDAAPYVP